jgi:hypothetical protein
MAIRIPVITSPCPLTWASLPEPGRDHCGHCDRQVHNLDGMGAQQREAFLRGCSGKVCVAYTVNSRRQRRNVALGAGLLAAMAGSTAMAGEVETALGLSTAPASPVEAAGPSGVEEAPGELDLIVVGGIEAGDTVRWADEGDVTAPDDATDLPTIAASEWLPSAAK